MRAQLNPHFLFNALNTIAFLIRSAPDRAQVTLMKLTSLLRAVLRSPANATLGEEIALVTAYLEIEQARFDERLRDRGAIETTPGREAEVFPLEQADPRLERRRRPRVPTGTSFS